jgi:hypothetical protein
MAVALTVDLTGVSEFSNVPTYLLAFPSTHRLLASKVSEGLVRTVTASDLMPPIAPKLDAGNVTGVPVLRQRESTAEGKPPARVVIAAVAGFDYDHHRPRLAPPSCGLRT